MISRAAPIPASTGGEVSIEPNDDPVAADIMTVRVVVWVEPSLSVTVRVTVKDPAFWNVWLTTLPVPVVPSPKFHE